MPQNRIFRACYGFYFLRVLPRIGGMISKDGAAYAYLPESVGEFPYGKRFTEILRDTGFRNARFKNLFGGVAQIYSAEKPVSST